MANAITSVQAVKREVILFTQEDFVEAGKFDLLGFKKAVASQIETLVGQNAELRFQHKGYVLGMDQDGNTVWAIDRDQLGKYAQKHGCILVQYGHGGNDYFWRIVPARKVNLISEEDKYLF